jgi:hypothetical protein
MVCRDICKEYKFTRTDPSSKQIYLDGAKRCNSFCMLFIRYEGSFCPCCGMKLRTRPRNKHGKAMLQKIDSKRSGAKPEIEPFIRVVR